LTQGQDSQNPDFQLRFLYLRRCRRLAELVDRVGDDAGVILSAAVRGRPPASSTACGIGKRGENIFIVGQTLTGFLSFKSEVNPTKQSRL